VTVPPVNAVPLDVTVTFAVRVNTDPLGPLAAGATERVVVVCALAAAYDITIKKNANREAKEFFLRVARRQGFET